MTDEEFITKYINLVKHHVYSYSISNETKEDVVQDCLIKLLSVKHKIDKKNYSEKEINYFVTKTIKNQIKDSIYFKSDVYVNTALSNPYEEDGETLIIENISNEDYDFTLRNELIDKINKLEQRKRFICVQLYNGYSRSEICEMLEISKQRLQVILDEIKKELEKGM